MYKEVDDYVEIIAIYCWMTIMLGIILNLQKKKYFVFYKWSYSYLRH